MWHAHDARGEHRVVSEHRDDAGALRPVSQRGGYYFQSIQSAIHRESDALVLLDVLARQVGVRGVFSDWPATVTYYANCFGL